MSKWIEDAVSKRYQPPNAGVAARKQVFILAGTALVVLSALATEEWLSWLLWGWAAYRATLFVLLVAIGPKIVEAWQRRWDGLAPMWQAYLTGKPYRKENLRTGGVR